MVTCWPLGLLRRLMSLFLAHSTHRPMGSTTLGASWEYTAPTARIMASSPYRTTSVHALDCAPSRGKGSHTVPSRTEGRGFKPAPLVRVSCDLPEQFARGDFRPECS